MTDAPRLTHFNASGQAVMVDVGGKTATARLARATGRVRLGAVAFAKVREGATAKGDVLGVARIAGIMAAKKVDQLIPLAHPLAISRADIEFSLCEEDQAVDIIATVGVTGQTGVEMEALTAVSVAALTIYDMCKAVDKTIAIDGIHLLEKSGGKSGHFRFTEVKTPMAELESP
ncbi:MAG: cyclic pyranopterin monophosphate synthase MoaC [Desulfobulbaceae bacterium]|jgi:cyclic pyranopterin phosphate synthase|nr:cyclic pyranopterin monophosphate synthase MoaC [Desulfobulbaceae bacterium]